MTNVQQATWVDKLAVSELLTKYFQLIDDRDFAAEKLLAIFTENGTVTRPNDSVVSGPAGIAESNHKSLPVFEQPNISSGYLVEITGDEATIRAKSWLCISGLTAMATRMRLRNTLSVAWYCGDRHGEPQMAGG